MNVQDASPYGRGFAKSGGVTSAITQAIKELGLEDFEFKPVIANGVNECRAALLKAKAGKLNGNFIEGMICEGGCIKGNGTLVNKKNTDLHIDDYCSASTKKTML
jgi:iron only hydrogenase large subunit-like protein